MTHSVVWLLNQTNFRVSRNDFIGFIGGTSIVNQMLQNNIVLDVNTFKTLPNEFSIIQARGNDRKINFLGFHLSS
nr:hypothetical protein [uncultured bacterium]